jgi:tetratricopeptide (TPR) repeat protein
MTVLKRLRVVPAVLGAAAALLAVGTTLFGDMRPGANPVRPPEPVRPDGGRLVEDIAVTKFSKLPALTYQPRDGETLFAWQVKPAVEAGPARPRDVLVVVDTSASQAGRPLQQARQVLTAVVAGLSPADRVGVWTANTPDATKALTKGFFAPNAEEVRDAAAALTDVEYGSGAVDLKDALNKALGSMTPARGRQQVVLFLGDGESALAPVSEADRIDLGTRMDATDVAFFAVPLGVKVNPQNLHGLAAQTGGVVARLDQDLAEPAKRAEWVKKLVAAIDAPVVKVDKFKFSEEVAEVYPTKLPPLRADRTTLVMGKLAKPAARLGLEVKGTAAGRPVAATMGEALPAPQLDHFFLNVMLDQWRDAPHKDAPAMLQSDRALALASTQVKLYRDEFLTQAVWAVTKSQWDDAGKLYQAALRIDPRDPEAAAGVAMIDKLKAGKMTLADIQKKVSTQAPADPAPKQDPPGAAPPAGPAPAAADLLREAAARRQVEEQRTRVLVDETIRAAQRLLRTNPDAAYDDLKRQRDDIDANDAIGPAAKAKYKGDLEAVMQQIRLKRAEIVRQSDLEREAVARSRQQLNEFDQQQDEERRVKNRLDQFRELMKRARFELAYQEAQLLIQERVVKGQSIPPQAVASYIIGQQATQLREWRELTRIREERFLLTMLQTEKSHIPYPDEPPVHFPPAAVWRELTSLRKEAYENSNLGPNPSPTQRDLKSKLENAEVRIEGNVDEQSLKELLTTLARQHGFTYVINYQAIAAEPDGKMADAVNEQKPRVGAAQLRGLKLGTYLDIVLLSLNYTYIVRPEYIEITTFNRRLEEKVTRVFPVADLVIPIPSSVNQQTLFQNLAFQQSQLAIFGQVIGAANFFGNNGGFNNGFNNQGNNNNNNNLGNNFFGMQGMQMFGQNMNGVVNQGFGAGGLQVGGGQLGQFGNLGGQFGLQGGDQSQLLLNIITETVARGEWAQAQQVDPNDPNAVPVVPINQLNSLGYYPPARALIIRGTSRYHPAATVKLKKQDGMALGPVGPRNAVAGNAPPNGPNPPAAGDPDPKAVAAGKPTLTDPKVDAVALKKNLSKDPRVMWTQAIDWTVSDPGLIVASAEFLMEMDEFASAAEVLKASLRKGLTTDAWAHESLAVALQATGSASPAEVERAAVSAVDLDPADHKAYLKAAKAEAELKNHARAVAFCRRAAEVAPDQPAAYANALAFAEAGGKAVATDAVAWAADNLLRRDWSTTDGIDYHAQVKARLPKLVADAEAAGRKADGLKAALAEQTRRDLVVELLWQGTADLDLTVAEPGGSVCSTTHKRTTGGGVLKSDALAQGNDRSEVYTAALGFKGAYTVTVRQAYGQPVGQAATLKVTKYKGTPRESHDLVTVDLRSPKPVEVKLDHGSRTELAVVSADADEFRADTTGAALGTGFGGGFGSLAAGPEATTGGANLPVVNAAAEARIAGVGASADIRTTMKVNPDRKSWTVQASPVFGTGKPVATPRVPLLPGGEAR